MLSEEKEKKINATLEELKRLARNSYDIVEPNDGVLVKITEDNKIKMAVLQADLKDVKEHELTEHAHGQLAMKTKIPKRYYDD